MPERPLSAPVQVNADADPVKDPAGKAAEDLARVQSTVEATRVVLARLLQEVLVAESRLSNSRATQMLEANEQLVVTALRNQTDAQIAAKLLAEVSRSAELDPLTQLPNRVLLLDRVAQAITNAKRRIQPACAGYALVEGSDRAVRPSDHPQPQPRHTARRGGLARLRRDTGERGKRRLDSVGLILSSVERRKAATVKAQSGSNRLLVDDQ